jgi:hypothetical protein
MRISKRYLVLAVLVAGCAKPSLVGEWKGARSRDAMTGTARLSLQEDAQFSMTVSVVSTSGAPGLARQVSAGTYKATRDTLLITVRSMKIDGAPVPVPPRGALSKVHYTVRGNTLILDLGKKNRLTLHRV